ncbi:MAG: Uma2 family endonuclease [Gemmatimonadaceae bacterium]
MPDVRTDWTLEEVHALPDNGSRYELIDGELLVTPAPSGVHQRCLQPLTLLLQPFGERLGIEVLQAPYSVRLPGGGEVQPDLVAFPRGHHVVPPDFSEVRDLILAVEVVSATSARADRFRKRQLYLSAGIPEYWIVDLGNRLIGTVDAARRRTGGGPDDDRLGA